jgi:hypothetical protein
LETRFAATFLFSHFFVFCQIADVSYGALDVQPYNAAEVSPLTEAINEEWTVCDAIALAKS